MADEVPDSAVVPAALAYTLGGDQGVRNPELAEKYRNEYKTRGEKFALDYEDVMSKRQAEVENAKRILDETAAALRAGHTGEGPGQMNLPLLQMAAGFFKPTRSGNFGEEFGNALSGLAGGIGNQRMRDDEFNRGMADLTLKRSSFEQEPLKDRAALLKAQQLQQEKSQQAIELAQMKTAGGSGLSPIAKIEADFNAGRITRQQADEAIKKLTNSEGNAPREEKLYNRAKADWQAANPGRSPADFPSLEVWMAEQKGRGAAAVETGKAAAEAEMALPKLLSDASRFGDTVDRILALEKHLDKIVGPVNGRFGPNAVFNTDAQALLNYIEELKSQQFGTAAASMRGLGALSNAEGEKIQAAVGRLNRLGDPTKFIEDLKRIRESTVKIASDLARQQVELGKRATGAGRDAGATPPSAAPGGAGAPAPPAGGLVQGADGVYRLSPGGR